MRKENKIHANLLSLDQYIKRHKEKHGENEYDYSKTIYNGIDKNIIMICKKHGEFNSIAVNLSGCKLCYIKEYNKDGEYKLSSYNKIKYENAKNEFVNKSNIIHDNKYDYSKTDYINSVTKVIIICKNHGEFMCSPNNHLNSKGCPKCFMFYSKISIGWLKYREITDKCKIIHFENEGEYAIPNTLYKADGYCKETNTIYEFHGTHYHGDPRYTDHSKINFFYKNYGELYQKTLLKEKIIKEKGYNLITIWEEDWNRFLKNIIFLQRKIRYFLGKRILFAKKRYENRHKSRENWNDPTSRGSLSKYILWNKPSLQASIADYKRRFKL